MEKFIKLLSTALRTVHGLHLPVYDVLYKSGGVAHITVEDCNYDEKDDENEGIFEEGLATSISRSKKATAFNLEIENVGYLKKYKKRLKHFEKAE